MPFPSFGRRRPAFLGCLALAALLCIRAGGQSAADPAARPADAAADHRRFSTPDALSTEAMTLVSLLQQDHYNRDAVRSSDYAEVIPDYMAELDGMHLFFLASDEADFSRRYGQNVFNNVAFLGNIDPAYDIFYTYQARAEKRIRWIFDQLKQNYDFSSNETYSFDRSKSPWPSTPEAADDLWRRELKYELIGEMLNKKTLDQAKEIVGKRYERALKNLTDTEGSELAETYLHCITQLYDPHSDYLGPENLEDFAIQMKLKLVGIGAVLESKDDYCVVREIVPGSPADLGHQLRPKDKIISVAQDGQPPVEVIGMKLPKIVTLIRGDKGTRVHLVVQPADATDPAARKTIVITRDLVNLDSARAHAGVFQVPGANGQAVPLGVISLPAFYGAGDDGPAADRTSASADVGRLIGQLKQAGVQGIVLDLRHNGGGLLAEAINVTGLFLHPGAVVQVKDMLNQLEVEDDNAPAVAYDGPLAVLVDRFSASASEIVAGALQNYGRAVIVGDSSTHGKGTVQTVLDMKDALRPGMFSPARMGAAKITIQKFYLPNGSSTQLRGVRSDIVLPSADEFLPIGESDLPHALVWDQIAGTPFDGAPVGAAVLRQLNEDSQRRQSTLDEFAYLRENIDWFKNRLDESKVVSLNLDARHQEQKLDDAFKKKMQAEKALLAKNDYPYQEFRLGAVPPPKVAAPAKTPDAAAPSPDDPDDEDDDATAGGNGYAKVDVELRETLRILNDALALGRDHGTWANDHAPLTVAEAKG
jgi:carboxyl-terminal processing protease